MWVGQRKKSAVARFAAKFFKPGNVLLALLWVAWLALVVYVQSHAQESELFDPYELLQACSCLPLLAVMPSDSRYPSLTICVERQRSGVLPKPA